MCWPTPLVDLLGYVDGEPVAWCSIAPKASYRQPPPFLTWLEYAAEDAEAFEGLVSELRATEEWRYVAREGDLRLRRPRQAPAAPGAYAPALTPLRHRNRVTVSHSACRPISSGKGDA